MVFLKASGDKDNVSNIYKPCNRIWLHAAWQCQAVCLSRQMESGAKSVSSMKCSSFPGARRLRLANIPLLFIVGLLKKHFSIIAAIIPSSVGAFKLICMIIIVHYSWTLGDTQVWFHLVQFKSDLGHLYVVVDLILNWFLCFPIAVRIHRVFFCLCAGISQSGQNAV